MGWLAIDLDTQFDFDMVGPDGLDHDGYQIGKHGSPRGDG